MSGRTMIARATWPHTLHTRIHCYAVGKLFLQAAYQIISLVHISFRVMYMSSVFHFDVPARARRENGQRLPLSLCSRGFTPLPVLPSKTCRPFEVLGLVRIGADPIDCICGIQSDLIVASSSGAVPRPGRKGRGHLLPRGQGWLLANS